MAEPQAGKGSSAQLQATIRTVLEAIRGIQRNNQTTMGTMEKSFEEKLEDLRRIFGEAGKSMQQAVTKDELKREVPIQKERK